MIKKATLLFSIVLSHCSDVLAQSKAVKESTYVYENDSLVQTARIVFINNKTISFQLISHNKKRNLEKSISDTAITKSYSGLEDIAVLEDEVEEAMFGTNTFKSKKKNLDIDIEKLAKDKLQVHYYLPNTNKSAAYCPFESRGTLRKKT